MLCPEGIGRFIHATPALKVLSQAIGAERLVALATGYDIAWMARQSPLFGEVHAWDPEREGKRQAMTLLKKLRAERFTHSLSLFPAFRTRDAFFHRLAGADFRMGFRYPHQRLPEWTQHHSLPLADAHDVRQNLRLADAFLRDPAVNPPKPFLPFDPVLPAGVPADPFFACHPGSGSARGVIEKRFSPELFSDLILRVHRETGWRCVLVGGPEEHALRAAVTMGCREAVATVPTRSLAETAGLLRASRFFLGGDSGMLPLAAAAGAPCAACFGPSDERRTGPFGGWEELGDVSPHLILRRPGSKPAWTLETLGAEPPVSREDRAQWRLDPEKAWEELRGWMLTVG